MSTVLELSPLRQRHEELGARFGDRSGRELVRGYTDPAAEYAALRGGAAIVDRWDRAQLRLHGRDPVGMVQGLITNDLAGAPDGRGVYAALLTARGRMLADLRAYRLGDGAVLLDLDIGAVGGAVDHMKKFVPPLFARIDELGDSASAIGVYGPESRALISNLTAGWADSDLAEESFIESEFEGESLLVTRTDYTGTEGYDLFISSDHAGALWDHLLATGGVPVGQSALDIVRLEAGRPRWGVDLDERVFPIEAGLTERAISQTKGCYTGQEVIIRILHRGRVNWHLRGLFFGDTTLPEEGTELYRPGETRSLGRVTSAALSPYYDQVIGLGYIRREVEPPAVLSLGSPDGDEVRVVELPFGGDT